MIACITQDLGKSGNLLVEKALITWHASLRGGGILATLGEVLAPKVGPFDEIPKAGDMVICACKNHRSCRGTCSGRVETGESNAIFTELVNVWGVHPGSEKPRSSATMMRKFGRLEIDMMTTVDFGSEDT